MPVRKYRLLGLCWRPDERCPAGYCKRSATLCMYGRLSIRLGLVHGLDTAGEGWIGDFAVGRLDWARAGWRWTWKILPAIRHCIALCGRNRRRCSRPMKPIRGSLPCSPRSSAG
ncbi:hypothetical protein MESS2_1590073 [Mesorhizobium metallidurans STM 2683]|uniref:Uncharacterized protein n=1 Tax=Mesorhizobium metallidurans STM 2683 TaxID=1297569 RepID=M5F170_9HYPH|nr:hypothetical protein MESS2_1590073 [Mesorhizobium metallidurans STM 2683]